MSESIPQRSGTKLTEGTVLRLCCWKLVIRAKRNQETAKVEEGPLPPRRLVEFGTDLQLAVEARHRRSVVALAAAFSLLGALSTPTAAQDPRTRTDSGEAGSPPASTADLCTPQNDEGAIVEGSVLERGAGSPLPGAEVRMAVLPAPDEGSLLERTTAVNARGEYRFCDLPGSRSARLTAIFGGFMGAMQRVELVAGETVTADLRVSLGRAAYVLGWVRDAERGWPVENAMVQFQPLGLVAFTNDQGRFKLPRVPPGTYVLSVEHIGFGPRSTLVEVEPGAGLEVDLRLPVRAIAMEPLEVTVESRPLHLMRSGFYERAELGLGRYLTPEDLERRNPARLRHLFMGLPGVRVPPCRDTFDCPEVPVTLAGCGMSVWVDGVRTRGGLWWLRAQEVAAVEVYDGPAEMPGRFQGAFGRCGAVVLWTKR